MRGTDLLRAALLCLLAPSLVAQQRAARRLKVGETVQGRLQRGDVVLSRDSTYAKEWQLDASAGLVVTIDLASDSVDAYLIVYGPGLPHDLQDDDSGGSCNARITVRFPTTGAYHIVVTTSEKRQVGPFTLSVTAGSKPKALSRCRRTR